MDVDSPMHGFSCGESSSAQAAAAPPPHLHGLTAEALKALGEEGSQVLVYSESHSRPILFNGSNSKAPIGLFADDSDIFADVDPDCHMLIVQHGDSTIGFSRPTEDKVRIIKAVIPRCLRTNEIFAEAFTMTNLRTNLKRKQQLLQREGGSRDVKLPSTINNSSLIFIKKVSRKLRPSNRRPDSDLNQPPPSIEQLMKRAREKDEGCAMVVVFGEWKLSTPALSALPLVPSLHSDLPWFYMANPGTSQGNHLFGNITAQQSFLVANSGLQSSNRLLYSKDGWLLLRGRDLLLFGKGRGSPKYSMFLLNPITGARIDLPGFCYPDGCAAFCTTSTTQVTRTPGVVICGHFTKTIVRIYMARPGPGGAYSYWEEHPYVFRPGPLIGTPSMKMFLCGGSVYYFYTSFSSGCLSSHCLIFKLADLSWHLLTGESLKHFIRYEPLEVEGKLVLVGHPQDFTNPLTGLVLAGSISIPFFRMEIIGDRFYWVEMKELDDGRLWFIDRLQSFSVKVAGSGQKICWFAARGICGVAYAIHCLNLTTRAHCRLTTDSVLSNQHAWVDLGCLSHSTLLDHGITGDDLFPDF